MDFDNCRTRNRIVGVVAVYVSSPSLSISSPISQWQLAKSGYA
jgi:hypothetical protein